MSVLLLEDEIRLSPSPSKKRLRARPFNSHCALTDTIHAQQGYVGLAEPPLRLYAFARYHNCYRALATRAADCAFG
jgi:hypothetical protein